MAPQRGEKKERKVTESLRKNWWKKGQSGNPAGRRKGSYCAATLFRRALERFESENKLDIFELFLQRAAENDQVLVSAMNKLIPNKAQVSVSSEDINGIVEDISDIVTRNVTDPELLKKICSELEQLELKTQF